MRWLVASAILLHSRTSSTYCYEISFQNTMLLSSFVWHTLFQCSRYCRKLQALCRLVSLSAQEPQTELLSSILLQYFVYRTKRYLVNTSIQQNGTHAVLQDKNLQRPNSAICPVQCQPHPAMHKTQRHQMPMHSNFRCLLPLLMFVDHIDLLDGMQ